MARSWSKLLDGGRRRSSVYTRAIAAHIGDIRNEDLNEYTVIYVHGKSD
jgi:hypothetical protein